MRQLSAPGRFAVWIVTSLAVAASTGCMSVGEDEGKPAPSRSAEDQDTAAEPDGVTGEGAGAGEPYAWQGRTEGGAESSGADGRGKEGGDEKGDGKSTSDRAGGGDNGASPSASSDVTPSPEPSKGTRPQPGKPAPPGDGPEPPKEPTRPAPPASPPPGPQDPEPQPEPEPTRPPEQPSASPAADVRTGAMSAADGMGMRKEPAASPQLGPV
ncbi:hypothetical protein ACFRCX_20130 [Streptomyces sp. NPDC056652]|uniref:hypothetical protein n=1 Tax=Streptomyces sp. NPDC056652 TaxID=3345893 RepID=UPI0036B7ADDC